MIDKLEKEVDLIQQHIEILKVIDDLQPAGIVSLSNNTEYDRHEVRYSLRILEQNDLIDPTNSGAVTTDEYEEFIGEFNRDLSIVADDILTLKFEFTDL